jgi:DNA-binding NarL/FixJ family response regulator
LTGVSFLCPQKEAVIKKMCPTPVQHRPVSSRKFSPGTRRPQRARTEVLYFLSQGWTNKEIAAELTVTVNTVKKHTQSIFTKLNVNNGRRRGQALGGEKKTRET